MKDSIHLYDTITQRVAAANQHMLRAFEPCLPPETPAGDAEAAAAAQRDLHNFLAAWYQAVYDRAEAFGLPATPDDALVAGEPNEKDRKQEITRKMKKPRDLLNQALDFLIHAGAAGTVNGTVLHVPVDETLAAFRRSRNLMKFLQGMQLAGLVITEDGQEWILANDRFPVMMPAMQALAKACATHSDTRLGRLNFARCDFHALTRPDYEPDVPDLYRGFGDADARHLAAVHAFFMDHGYQTELGMGGKFDWVVKYQGNRKVKSTPLFQVEFQERYRDLLQMQVKCVSTQRITALLPLQSETLQADFVSHAFRCRGEECGWCRNQKTLGPGQLEYHGEILTLCWYNSRTLFTISEDEVDLIKEYALMHEQLAEA